MDMVLLSRSEERPTPQRLGTRFRVFAQSPVVPGYAKPELIWVSTPPHQITPGPADRRMYVVDPVGSKQPYSYPYLPPFAGPHLPPVEAGPDGHFDHLAPGTREFEAAHVFACVRRVLDICESYYGREIPWFFQPTLPRLEIVPRLPWNNAQSGFGFLEMGENTSRAEPEPFALNFDAIAHEVGHLVVFGIMGLPGEAPSHEYLAYHEAAADFVALIGLLHFDTALDLVLRRTRGDLMIANELDRFADLSDERQVRLFSHSLRMGDVGNEVHDYSRPFAGSLFDSLIEIYQTLLFERGISDLDPDTVWSLRSEWSESDWERVLSRSAADYEPRHFAWKSALAEARDLMGEVLVNSWERLTPDTLGYRAAAEAMIAAAEAGRARRFADGIEACFRWREIL